MTIIYDHHKHGIRLICRETLLGEAGGKVVRIPRQDLPNERKLNPGGAYGHA